MLTPRRPLRALSAAFLLSALAASICPAQEAAQPAKQQPAPEARPGSNYVRVVDSEDGNRVTLQVSIRTYAPTAKQGPTVNLVGAVHIGDKHYYKSLQEYLDSQDLVLFEGVKPANSDVKAAKADDAAKVKVTKSRQRLLAMVIERYKAEHNRYPKDFGELLEKTHGTTARLGRSATKDAWGHVQTYTLTKADKGTAFDIISDGADGAPGGDNAAADIRFSDQKPLTKAELKAGGEGIQVQLANALGLEFQLVAIDYDRQKWRNSDLSVDQLQDKLEAAGVSGGALFSMLDGSSISAKLVGLVLGLVKASPDLSSAMKIMMVEMLARADELMAASGDAMGKGMGDFMKVLVVDRNAEVFKDLDNVIAQEPEIKTVALFFGAGHLPDMERRLGKMGYTLKETQWKNAIDLDLTKIPGGKAQARQMRQMMSNMLDAQMKAGKKPPAEQPAGLDAK